MTNLQKVLFLWFSILLFTTSCTKNDDTEDTKLEQAYSYYYENEYKKAYQIFKPLAEKGNSGAQFALGVMFSRGRFVALDYQKAIEWFKKSASQGNSMSEFNLGMMYEFGYGVEQDYLKAIEWFKKSASQGNSMSEFSLALMYQNGHGVEQNYPKATEWFSKSANGGNSGAQFSLGTMYEFGYGVEQDYLKAIEWYVKAAMQGHTPAQESLARIYADEQNGIGVNYKKAYLWNSIALKTSEFLLKGKQEIIENKDFKDFAANLKQLIASQKQHLSEEEVKQAKIEIIGTFEVIKNTQENLNSHQRSKLEIN